MRRVCWIVFFVWGCDEEPLLGSADVAVDAAADQAVTDVAAPDASPDARPDGPLPDGPLPDGPLPDAAPDETPPMVRFVDPPQAVDAAWTITLEASDDVALGPVVLFEGEAELARWEAPPFTFEWAPEDARVARKYGFRATAQDLAGNQAEAEAQVEWVPACDGPCVAPDGATAPPLDAPVCGLVWLSVGDAPLDVEGLEVTAQVDGQAVGEAHYDGVLWDSSAVADGAHALVVTLRYPSGFAWVREQAIEVANAGCEALGAQIAAPAQDGWVQDLSLEIEADATVRVFLDDVLVHRGEAGVVPLEAPEGPVAVRVVATDADGRGALLEGAFNVDRTAPVLAFVAPAEGAAVVDAVDVELSVEDAQIAEVRLGDALLEPPYQTQVDTSGQAAGELTLVATAVDAAGNQAQVERMVVVDRPPTIELVEPEPGVIIRGPTTVRVNAADDVALENVELLVDGQAQGSFDGDSFDWVPAFEAGPRTLTVVATDSRGQTAAAEVQVEVDHPLTVELDRCSLGACEPLLDAIVVADDLALRARVADDDGEPGRVVFVIARDTPEEARVTDRSPPYELLLDTRDFPDGDLRIDASAVSVAGDVVEVSRTVRVNNCDRDEDNFVALVCGGDDCADDNPEINVDAVDDTIDGVDQNCDDRDGLEPDMAIPDAAIPDAEVDAAPIREGELAAQTLGPAMRMVEMEFPQDLAAAQAAGCTVVGSNGGSTLADWLQRVGQDGLTEFVMPDEFGRSRVLMFGHAEGWRDRELVDEVGSVNLRVLGTSRAFARYLVQPAALTDPLDFTSDAVVEYLDTAIAADGQLETTEGPFLLPFPLNEDLVLTIRLENARISGRASVDGPGIALDDGLIQGYWTNDGIREWLGNAQQACQLPGAPALCLQLNFFMPPDWRDGVGTLRNFFGGFDTRWVDGGPVACDPADCDAISVCVVTAARGSVIHGLEAVPDDDCVRACDQLSDCATWTHDECADLDAYDRVRLRESCLLVCEDPLAAPVLGVETCAEKLQLARVGWPALADECPAP